MSEEKTKKDSIDKFYNEFYKALNKNIKSFSSYTPQVQLETVEERLQRAEEEKEKIKNEGLKQDIKLKKTTLITLFVFLSIETLLIFFFSYLQAIHVDCTKLSHPHWGLECFHLEEWSFKLLITATISQITIMLLVAVKHLFPQQK